jgi:hypothetical protein
MSQILCFCTTCGKEPTTIICSKCKSAFYCNEECQKKNWEIHNKICMEYNLPTEEFNNEIKINCNKVNVQGHRSMYRYPMNVVTSPWGNKNKSK